MTVDPTPMSLEERLARLESMVISEYEPPAGPQYSFPAPHVPLDNDQWQQINRATGSGVIDGAGYPFRLGTPNDADNTIAIEVDSSAGVAEAVIDGFFFRQTETIRFTVPGVLTPTRYTFACQLDPVRASEGGQPIVLDLFTGNLDRSQGRKYVILWEGTRQPSTVLSQMTWVQRRHRVAPTIHVASPDYLPDPNGDGLLYGTICYAGTGTAMTTYQLTGTYGNRAWSNTQSAWTNLWLPAARYWPGWGYRPQQLRTPWGFKLRGVIRRGAPNAPLPFYGGTSYTAASILGVGAGTAIPTLSGVARYNGGYGIGERGEILIETNGDIRVTPQRDVNTIALDGLEAYID